MLFCVRLTREQEGVFSDLRRLVTLDLTHNNISSVEPRVFDDSANLSSLSRIFLSHNQLTELEPWPLMRAQHREITVSLVRNRIAKFTNSLRWSFDCNSTTPLPGYLDLSRNHVEHVSDFVNGWNIDGECYTACDPSRLKKLQ